MLNTAYIERLNGTLRGIVQQAGEHNLAAAPRCFAYHFDRLLTHIAAEPPSPDFDAALACCQGYVKVRLETVNPPILSLSAPTKSAFSRSAEILR